MLTTLMPATLACGSPDAMLVGGEGGDAGDEDDEGDAGDGEDEGNAGDEEDEGNAGDEGGGTAIWPGIIPSSPGLPSSRITLRSGCTAAPSARSRSARSIKPMHSAIGSRRSTSAAPRYRSGCGEGNAVMAAWRCLYYTIEGSCGYT